ncbi:MAG: electron transfer flavoprotein subunit alpha [Omnitrophica bacterium RIFCSPLOWO2_12_FULL_44_17]|uniref:Electron transfer flavoprotein subunit alpha n=1 Tax=Candidatus Danuiimicrobium aquiferis TaxID=1801832 RepID=A0A1G1KV46_9BACT|nr:MAG: electron transfer flavoprotein subunit alpha [Omnitrophica bacterium RIFCSPHIGHO2_02_FULL_45_28]OGW88553.1 MAG: electron transfer flavoprotein subunit alpha [Omnitrophica bacterium RIFCSPHIGHO2_12_FULL_44_12]OGW96828.1 MAG: electron transfer flavoprotein subunit alpha [Omnitrophica bacterium RIFCSPLOWO2_12_FULL_44_17]OGX03830.1 MAG: electron transfer flavoprotein subunit alpha [Omnitrophica bacterium RIFCSPLOWO2_02_FULL_44_11]
METILYIAHTESNGSLSKASMETLTAASDLAKKLAGATFVAGLIGENVQSAVNAVSNCGASKFYAVEGADFGSSRYASDVAALEILIRTANATIVLASSTSRFCRAMPGVAYRLKGLIDTHVSGFETGSGKLEIQRWYYRQRMVASMSRTQRPWLLLVDSGIYPAFQAQTGSATLQKIDMKLDESKKKTKVVGLQAPQTTAQTIRPDAALLFVAGAGWTKKQADGQIHIKDAERIILDFLNSSNASLGSSKSLVDQGSEGEEVLPFLSHLNQVGQTGSTPRHPKGLAACCHGEEPHTVGWRFINERRAVNLDPNCGWAQGKADVLYVADAFQVMTKVTELLTKK